MQFWENNNDEDSGESGNNPRPPQPPPNWRRWVSPGLLVLVMLLALISSPGLLGGISSTPEIAYSDFYEQLLLNNVATFDYQDTTAVVGEFKSSIVVVSPSGRTQSVRRFTTRIPVFTGPEIERLRLQNDIKPVAQDYSSTSPWISIILNFLPLVLIIGFFVWMGRRAQGQMNGIFSFGQSQAREKTPEMPAIRFDDVAGKTPPSWNLKKSSTSSSSPKNTSKSARRCRAASC